MAETLLIASYTLVTVGLLYFFLRTSLTNNWSTKKQLQWWVLFGFIFNLYSFSWIYAIYPVSWMKAGVIQLVGIFGIHILVAVTSGVCFSVVGFSFYKKINLHCKPFMFATLLVLAEILRSFFISLLSYKEGSTLDLHFVIGTLGSALAPTPFIEYAYFGGTFILTFILGYITYSFASKKHSLLYWKHGLAICIILFGIHFFVPAYRPAKALTVGVITTDFHTRTPINKEDFASQNKQLDSLTTSLAMTHPNIILYPEDTRYLNTLKAEDSSRLATLFPSTLFIDGDTRVFDNKNFNVSLFYNPTNERGAARGKSFLLPFGEYTPPLFSTIFSFFIGKEKMDFYLKNHTYTQVISGKTVIFEQIRIGTLLCSEILSYRMIQDLRKENPSIVFFQSKMSLFHNSSWVNAHMYLLTKVTAAQLRSPLVGSVNNAPSYIVSPYGKILKTIPTGFSTSTYTFYK